MAGAFVAIKAVFAAFWSKAPALLDEIFLGGNWENEFFVAVDADENDWLEIEGGP